MGFKTTINKLSNIFDSFVTHNNTLEKKHNPYLHAFTNPKYIKKSINLYDTGWKSQSTTIASRTTASADQTLPAYTSIEITDEFTIPDVFIPFIKPIFEIKLPNDEYTLSFTPEYNRTFLETGYSVYIDASKVYESPSTDKYSMLYANNNPNKVSREALSEGNVLAPYNRKVYQATINTISGAVIDYLKTIVITLWIYKDSSTGETISNDYYLTEAEAEDNKPDGENIIVDSYNRTYSFSGEFVTPHTIAYLDVDNNNNPQNIVDNVLGDVFPLDGSIDYSVTVRGRNVLNTLGTVEATGDEITKAYEDEDYIIAYMGPYNYTLLHDISTTRYYTPIGIYNDGGNYKTKRPNYALEASSYRVLINGGDYPQIINDTTTYFEHNASENLNWFKLTNNKYQFKFDTFFYIMTPVEPWSYSLEGTYTYDADGNLTDSIESDSKAIYRTPSIDIEYRLKLEFINPLFSVTEGEIHGKV